MSAHPLTNDPLPIPRPPIMARSATFFSDLPEEAFERYFTVWQQEITDQLPKEHREPQWRFELDGYENGLPKLKSTQPAMLINAWNEKTLADQRGVNRARVFPSEGKGKGGISFTVERESSEYPRSYTELRHFLSELLPIYQKSFRVERFTAVELHYQNLVRSDLFPEFDPTGTKGIDLNLILETHKNLNLPGEGFMLPYKHEMTCRASADPEIHRIAKINIEIAEPVFDDQGKTDGRVNLLVDFKITQVLSTSDKGVALESALLQADGCHEKMLEFFTKTFTDHAREVFSRGTKSANQSLPE